MAITQNKKNTSITPPPLEATTLPDLLERVAARFPARIALQVLHQGAWVRLTYAEFFARAQAWGQRLGVAQEERVVLAAESSPAWCIAYFAVMMNGATVVPLDPQLSALDMQAVAARTHVQVWLLSSEVAKRVRAELSGDLPNIIEIDGFIAKPEGEEAAPVVESIAGSAIASLPFTSGTTLAPKGVPLTHTNFLANVRALLQVITVDARDQFLCVLPLHHVLAFTGSLLAPVAVGATITFVEKLTPKGLLEAMQGSGSTVVIAVPRLYAMLVRGIKSNLESASPITRAIFRFLLMKARAWRGIGNVIPPLAPAMRTLRACLFRPLHRRFGGHIRYLVSGGAALPLEYYDALDLFGFRVTEGYGLTETSPVLTLTPPDRPRRATVGPPVPGVELRIADPDEEGVGEVLVRGASVFRGYLDNEAATQQAFIDGWFRTGDLGRVDRHGYLHLAGRADDVIVTGGGKNVYPVEVEWLYRDLPHVKEFCVIGLPDPGSAGEAVQAVVVLEAAPEGHTHDDYRREIEAAITQRARQLPPHQRLRGVHVWEGDLPRTSTLKIKRRQLRAALLARHQERN